MDQFFIFHGFPKLSFQQVGHLVDLLQILQIPGRHPEDHPQYELRFQLGLHAPDHALREFRDDGVFPQGNRDYIGFGHQNPHRHGVIRHAVAILFGNRGVDDNQSRPILALNTGRFLFVQCGTKKIRFQRKLLDQKIDLLFVRINRVDPAAVLQFLQLADTAVDRLVIMQHLRASPFPGRAALQKAARPGC